MSQLPSQTLIALLQLILATFQFVFMIFTSYDSRRSRHHHNKDEEDLGMAFQHVLSTYSTVYRNSNIESGPLPQLSLPDDSSSSSTYVGSENGHLPPADDRHSIDPPALDC
ncbi:hypothetical protein HD806DRAFT_475320 [Xylariaceae sp. AK1471]|nr:hypothetical protein HD806DRAFT_475320 [Xylariaceae sp. AK1471]